MRIIAVDIGNSGTKWCVADPAAVDDPNAPLSPPQTRRPGDPPASMPDLPLTPCLWMVGSVHRARQQKWQEWVLRHRPDDQFHAVTAANLSLKIDLPSPNLVGVDRLVAAWFAWSRPTDGKPAPCVIVDSGTAVTVDLVDQSGTFQGGLIFPGLESAFEQLSSADALPAFGYLQRQTWFGETPANPLADPGLPLGKSTAAAIAQGIYQSQRGAIRFQVRQLISALRDPGERQRCQVWLTGGGVDELQRAHDAGLAGGADQSGHPGLWPADWHRDDHLMLRGLIEAGRRQLGEAGKEATDT